MAVFPAGSMAHVPPTWRPLMYESDSPIIDFYPTDFRIDLNGKKYAWMGKLCNTTCPDIVLVNSVSNCTMLWFSTVLVYFVVMVIVTFFCKDSCCLL